MFEVNSFQVPNILVDDLLEQLSGNDLKILLVIIRKTKGWNKEFDGISISQFQKITGIKNEKSIRKSIKHLLELNFIEKIEQKGHYNLYKIKELPKNGTAKKGEGYQKMEGGGCQKMEGDPLPKNGTHNNTLIQNTSNTKYTNNIYTHTEKKLSFDDAKKNLEVQVKLNELGVDENFLLELLSYREEIGSPLKTIKGVIGVLKKFLNVKFKVKVEALQAFEIMQENEWKTPETLLKKRINKTSKLEQKQLNTLRAVENFIKGGVND